MQNDFQADLTKKGSFGSLQDFLPVIGYDSDKELLENRKRQEQGLERLDSVMAAIDDAFALVQNVFATDADRVTGKLTISTEEGDSIHCRILTKNGNQSRTDYGDLFNCFPASVQLAGRFIGL